MLSGIKKMYDVFFFIGTCSSLGCVAGVDLASIWCFNVNEWRLPSAEFGGEKT